MLRHDLKYIRAMLRIPAAVRAGGSFRGARIRPGQGRPRRSDRCPPLRTVGMLLAEERLLVGLDPVRGSVVDSARQQLLVGLAGGLVGELALVGLVELSGGCFVAVGGPPVDPLLAAVGQALARPEGRRAADQLRRLDRGIGGVWSRLVDQGVLGWRRDHVVLFAVTWYPVLRSVVREELLERVRVAAVGDGEREPRAAVVLALVGLSRLLDVVAPGGPAGGTPSGASTPPPG